MSVDSFLKLKEIDSLTKMRMNFIRTKEEQENRLSKLFERRQSSEMQMASLKQEKISLHTKLADLEKSLKLAGEQADRLRDLGNNEDKINYFQNECDRLEEEGLLVLSQMDENDEQILDQKTFYAGIEKTIQEIQDEVSDETEKATREISNIDLRLKLLQEELPPDFQSLYIKTSAKKLAQGPFTRIDHGHCYFCRFKISRIEESEIDMLQKLKTCPQCSRIFLPYGA